MDGRRYSFLLVALALVFISMEASLAQGQGKAGNNKKAPYDAASTHYEVLKPSKKGQEKFLCLARGACNGKHLTCPSQCPERKPKKNKKNKGCFVDCSSKCEVTCKWRKPHCNGYGSLCYDPRFVGGDGVMFYFHGAKGGNFAIVSDDNLQINAHFIGTRPQGRTRDYYGEEVNVPTDSEAEWRVMGFDEREVVIERTDKTNGVKVTVAGLVELNVKVRAIGEEENKVHNYQLPANDAFAHLETQFKFTNLTDLVEGVLGKTYQPDYISPVKRGVPMPMMGGEDKYQTPSLYSPLCKACKFKGQVDFASI
ncbi:hypothetical protein ERO13_A07G117750v2 [Gossypium hirsutum]|nr:hypothetical protein ERO13_A07G117750v2 [Gossypium hirsutum]